MSVASARQAGRGARDPADQMKIDVVTIFPAMVRGATGGEGSWGGRIERGVVDIRVRDLRDYTTDRHRASTTCRLAAGPAW